MVAVPHGSCGGGKEVTAMQLHKRECVACCNMWMTSGLPMLTSEGSPCVWLLSHEHPMCGGCLWLKRFYCLQKPKVRQVISATE